MATLDIRPQREQRRRMRLTPPLLWSAGFHLTVLLLLLITMRHRETSEPLPPPGVAMVFESGSARGPRLPNPTREANLPPQPAAVPSPLAPAPPPEAAPPASAAAQPSRATSPLPVPPVPPQAAGATTQEAEAPPLISAPLAEPAPPPSPAKPVAPNQQAMVTPPLPARPLTPPAPQTAPRTPSPEAAPRAPAPPAQSARKSNGAPPMRLFAQSLPSLSKFSVGPALRGPTEIMPFAKISAAALGADWRNELAAWIEAHKYYPQAAAERGEQGVSEVRVVVNRDGHVESVELERQSGYQALDSGAVGLFHGAELPPFPIGTNEERVTIDLTIHYVIYRN